MVDFTHKGMNLMMRAVIIDDEELSIQVLQKNLEQFPFIQVINTYTSPKEIFSDLIQKRVDIVFLDIEMGTSNGLDIAEAILSIQPSIHIVFVTAHSEYAVQAFELNSIDYLLKPVSIKRLKKTIDRLNNLTVNSKENPKDLLEPKPITIKCFNELQVFQGHQLINFKTAKIKELFAFLLTHIDQYIHRDTILENLWPDQDFKKSKIHLHTCLSHLRKTLGSLGYQSCISFSNGCYSLHLDSVHCDAFYFDSVIERDENLEENNIDIQIELIEKYKGPYLELNHYEWAHNKSTYYHEKIMYIFDKVINFFEAEDSSKALYYLQRQLKLNPYLEKSVKKSMQILIKQGYRSEAVKLYQEFEDLLMEDLGIMPDQSIIQLYHSLINV